MTISIPPQGAPPLPSCEAVNIPVLMSRTSRTAPIRRSAFTQPTEPNNWRDRGACLSSEDPDMWFASLPTMRQVAISICVLECPVRYECGTWADQTHQPFGVWGGIDREASKTDEGKEGAARVPLLERVAAVELSQPGATLAVVAELVGYKNGKNLERALYRIDKRSGGNAGREAVRRLKPGSRNREEIQAKAIPVSGKGLTVDRDHPWLTQGALPVRKDGKNAQHVGKRSRRKSSATTGKESAA